MSIREMAEWFFMIAVITGGIVWYGVALGRKEDRDAESSLFAKTKSQKFPIAS